MALTDQEKSALNQMCPAAAKVALGDKIDDFVQGVLADGSVGTSEIADGAVTSAKLESSLQALVVGVASGYKLARGTAAVTGSADVDTGLATVVAVVASLHDAPSLNAMWVQAKASTTDGHIDLVVTKPTAANDVTPTASTTETNVDWIAIGT